jgi:hypothetical protein
MDPQDEGDERWCHGQAPQALRRDSSGLTLRIGHQQQRQHEHGSHDEREGNGRHTQEPIS